MSTEDNELFYGKYELGIIYFMIWTLGKYRKSAIDNQFIDTKKNINISYIYRSVDFLDQIKKIGFVSHCVINR